MPAPMPLIEALKDHEIHVRLSAIKSLGLLGDNRAVAELAGIVNDQKAGNTSGDGKSAWRIWRCRSGNPVRQAQR